MFVLYLLFFNGSAVSERIVSQQTRSDLRELLLDLDAQGWIENRRRIPRSARSCNRREWRLSQEVHQLKT